MTHVPTKVIKLSPAFLASLERVAPKKRRGRIRYVFALALLAVIGFIAADPFARDLACAKTRAAVAAIKKSQPASATPAEAQPAPSVEAPAKAPEVITVPTIVIGTDAGESTAPASPATTAPAKAKRVPRASKTASRHTALLAAQIPADI